MIPDVDANGISTLVIRTNHATLLIYFGPVLAILPVSGLAVLLASSMITPSVLIPAAESVCRGLLVFALY